MAQFTVNPSRFDPYKNFKFRVKWDGRYVAGVSKISALKRSTEAIEHREGARCGLRATLQQVAKTFFDSGSIAALGLSGIEKRSRK